MKTSLIKMQEFCERIYIKGQAPAASPANIWARRRSPIHPLPNGINTLFGPEHANLYVRTDHAQDSDEWLRSDCFGAGTGRPGAGFHTAQAQPQRRRRLGAAAESAGDSGQPG